MLYKQQRVFQVLESYNDADLSMRAMVEVHHGLSEGDRSMNSIPYSKPEFGGK